MMQRCILVLLCWGLAVAGCAKPSDAGTPDPQIVLRLRRTLTTLVGFGTRNNRSPASATRGIQAAERYLVGELRTITAAPGRPPLEVTTEPFPITQPDHPELPTVVVSNVIGTLPGCNAGSRARRLYFTAHYDSRATIETDGISDAPGANDNAAAVAMLIEVARALAGQCLPSTVVFVLLAGEEPGLYGSRFRARQARQRGEDIIAVLNSDIVGDPSPPPGFAPRPDAIRVFSEGLPRDPALYADLRGWGAELESPSRRIAWLIRDIARRETTALRPMLIPRPDRVMRGSDHLAFNEEGFAAIRFTAPYETWSRQHANVEMKGDVPWGDRLDAVDVGYLARVYALNVTVGVHMASMPPEPTAVRLFMIRPAPETTVRWQPVTGVRYEVWQRRVDDSDWQSATQVDGHELTIPQSPDEIVVGVRACQGTYCSPIVMARQRGDQ